MEHFNDKETLELRVKFITIEQVKRFVSSTNSFQGKVAIYSHDNYLVDGRSLMGIFALDLSKPVTIVCGEDNYREIFDVCDKLNIIED